MNPVRPSNRSAAVFVVRRLRKAGFEALFAGGCVRDMLLRRRAKDYDVATSARPEQILALFRRTLRIGAKFGVVMVLIKNAQVEVATFRTESGYADGRHPDQVRFTCAAEDASRRDFTVNGMFYDPIRREISDYVEGQQDLRRKLLRTIGDPDRRFGEDYLRMLRAVRFATQLGFVIEPATWDAILRHADKITRISGERIAAELEAILTHPARAVGARLLVDSSLCAAVFPGLDAVCANGGVAVLSALRRRIGLPLALAAFFAETPTEIGLSQCEYLKLSREQFRHLSWLLEHRGCLLEDSMGLAPLKRLLVSPYVRDLFDLQRAILKSRSLPQTPLTILRRRINTLKGVNIAPKPLLNGHEILALGATPGPMVGRIAEDLYVAQLSDQIQTPLQARRFVQNWLSRHAGGDGS
ncbi:MAG: CCA tRNA nucleotidyltransferase [Phycisphaerae bacterium]|nr:CCA tRNA nucleotidyltransferase [Phycisphaerae bacterium]